MKLPKLPYKGDKTRKSIFKFLGLNLTDNTQEGEFSDTQGLSSEHYPILTQRTGREELTEYDAVNEIFEWDGKKVVVAASQLYFDGVLIATISDSPKKFAVVNTHLIVFPDGLDIDMTSEYYDDNNTRHFKYENYKGKVVTGDGTTSGATTCTFASDGTNVTASLTPEVTHYSEFVGWTWHEIDETSNFQGPCYYTYGKDRAAVEACWTGSGWDQTALSALEHLSSPWGDNGTLATYSNEKYILIPAGSGTSFNFVFNLMYGTEAVGPSKSAQNNLGYYMVMEVRDGDRTVCSNWNEDDHNWSNFHAPSFTVYSIAAGTQKFSNTFKVGDFISSTNAPTNYEVEHVKVTALNDTTNTMTLNTYDEDAGTWTGTAFPTTQTTSQSPITFQKDYPDLDYICERGNRLWGVSNRTKTIYASQLGLPDKMYTDAGEAESDDIGAWSVAVGSEGEFTGICSYGGATCCWKENEVTKVLGDYPSNFYTSNYKIAGVQKNSDKSLQIINETLLYKGVNGVFSYTGSTPSLISGSLGRDVYHKAVAGTDGERYYISMKDEEDNPYLFTYDLVNGIWLKEDEVYVSSFARITGVEIVEALTTKTVDQFFMVMNEKVYQANLDNEEKFEWWAEFCPFYTMAKSNSSYTRAFGKMGYQSIHISLEMETGSRIQIFVKEDNKQYRLAYTQSPTRDLSITVPIRVGRCDRFQVKIKGYGRTKIRGMARDYVIGSEV